MGPHLENVGLGLSMVVADMCNRISGKCESPIEVGLLQGMLAINLIDRKFEIPALERPHCNGDWRSQLFIQHKVGNYRLDFAVHVTACVGGKERSAWIAVECDGHDFHERTKEQAARDKSRDRDLTASGFRILRFTGSEIYESTFACAAEVLMLVKSIVSGWDDE